MAAVATLNGHQVIAARVTMPSVGLWWATVEVERAKALAGPVDLVVGDKQLRGAVVSTKALAGRTRYRIVAGAGGWIRRMPPKTYARRPTEVCVTIAQVIRDMAEELGEQVGKIRDRSTGSTFDRRDVPASIVLHELMGDGWHVDASGVLHSGRSKPSIVFRGGNPRTFDDPRGRIVLEGANVAEVVPGMTIQDREILDVEHVVDGGAVRSILRHRPFSPSGLTSHTRLLAAWEFRVIGRGDEHVDLQVGATLDELEDLANVPIRHQGAPSVPTLGALAVVQFLGGDLGRPIATAFEEVEP